MTLDHKNVGDLEQVRQLLGALIADADIELDATSVMRTMDAITDVIDVEELKISDLDAALEYTVATFTAPTMTAKSRREAFLAGIEYERNRKRKDRL